MITSAQIDPNGLCNSDCWFCPVAYKPNPEHAKGNMPIEMFESILKQLQEGKGTFVDPNLTVIYTAHYNEILLYKHLEELFQIMPKYGFKTDVLSNGIAFTKSRIDLLDKYPDAVHVVNLNIPSLDPATWSRLVKKPEGMLEKIKENIHYALNKPNFKNGRIPLRICVNGISDSQLVGKDNSIEHIEMLENAPEYDTRNQKGTQHRTVNQFMQIFPGVDAYAQTMVDRAGLLADSGIVSNMPSIEKRVQKQFGKSTSELKVIGCGYGHNDSRTENWVHINSIGDLFLCCNDFDMTTNFGNVKEKSIKEIWNSQRHQRMIQIGYDNMCRKCTSAIWAEK
jgi:MoaA/NifB/PqqE/SkfB family radical SAM enzyme